ALITRRAGVAVRATRYLLAVRVGGRLDLHSDGLGPGQEEEIAAEILEDSPDDHGGSRLIVDVRYGDHHYGRLAALFPEGTRFFPQERELLEAYAAHAAAILNTATALEETRRQNRTASVLLSLARSLSVVALPREVAGTLVRAVTNLVECESTSVLLWEEATQRLRLTAASGVDPGIESTLAEAGITMTDTPELSAMLTRPEPRFYDYGTADAFHRSVIGPQRPSIAVVPILAQGTFFGVLAVGIRRDLAELEADTDLIEQLAGIAYQAGAALQNAALLDQVRHQALHDSLTGLPNRSLLADRVERALLDGERSGERVGLAFLDLDRFKKINDTLGHRAGDTLLVQVAERISRTLRASDTVARLGGDEFVLLVPHLHQPEDAEQVSKSVLDALLAPFRVDGQELFIAASIGLSVSGESCRDYEELLKQADMAM
ncbi:MAG: diguanylate cyclase domain-containing protein, partial [Acidimicrobiales bacterium]